MAHTMFMTKYTFRDTSRGQARSFLLPSSCPWPLSSPPRTRACTYVGTHCALHHPLPAKSGYSLVSQRQVEEEEEVVPVVEDRRSHRIGGSGGDKMSMDFGAPADDPKVFRNVCRDRTHSCPFESVPLLTLS